MGGEKILTKLNQQMLNFHKYKTLLSTLLGFLVESILLKKVAMDFQRFRSGTKKIFHKNVSEKASQKMHKIGSDMFVVW